MFQPDGSGTLVVLWGLGLACLVLFALFGHYVGGRGWKHMLGRLSVVFITALVVVIAVTATLNRNYGWYTTWSDLKASFSGQKLQGVEKNYGEATKKKKLTYNPTAAEKVNAAADKKYAADRAAFAKKLGLRPSGPEGQWVKFNVPGLDIKGKDIGRVMVWLPQEYMANPNKSFPVVQAFHGMPGGTLDYKRVFFLDKAINKAVKDGQMRNAIVVVAQQMPAGIDTECVNGGGLNMETWLTETVPNFIIKNFRTQADHNSWATLGVSAGGWCASMAGLLHPNRYAGVVSLGGYFKPEFANWNPFKGKPLPKQYDLTKQIHEHPTDQAIWLLISGADKISATSTEDFAKAVRKPNLLTTMDYPDAGHRVDVWVQALPDVLQWVGKTLPAFSPTKGSPATGGSTPSSSTQSSSPQSTLPPSSSPYTAPGQQAPRSGGSLQGRHTTPGVAPQQVPSHGVAPEGTWTPGEPAVPTARNPVAPRR